MSQVGLLLASGRELRIEAAPIGRSSTRANSVRGQLGEPKHGVGKLRVFGSVARDRSDPESDIDLLAELKPERTLLDLAGFRREAAEILELPVDVATPDMLKDHVRTEAQPLMWSTGNRSTAGDGGSSD